MDFNHNDDTLSWAQLQSYKLNICIKFDNFLLFLDNPGFSIGTELWTVLIKKWEGNFPLKSFGTFISFTSYEQPIRISNFCNEFLFMYLLIYICHESKQ